MPFNSMENSQSYNTNSVSSANKPAPMPGIGGMYKADGSPAANPTYHNTMPAGYRPM